MLDTSIWGYPEALLASGVEGKFLEVPNGIEDCPLVTTSFVDQGSS